MSQLTTPNIARDLDRIRAGLRERKLSFYGVSWGTWLGASYRSLFPRRVQRMWLDSPTPPWMRFDAFSDKRAAAIERNAKRFAAWLAERNGTYKFGATAVEVTRALAQMRRDYAAKPKRFSEPDVLVDGFMIAQINSGFSLSWALAARLLAQVRATPNCAPAPKAAKDAWGLPPDDGR